MDKDFDALKETIAEREKELIQLKQEYREKQNEMIESFNGSKKRSRQISSA